MTISTAARPSTGLVKTRWATLDASEATIQFDAVSKRYEDGTTAVDSVSLECPAQKITVFVGPSGCGKTTSLRMINRMIAPTGGRIRIGGIDTTKLDEIALRRQMGYVIQNAGLFPNRRVIDNIATVPRLLGTPRGQARASAAALMTKVGLDSSLANRYPYQLSGGQQQRVGVARALASDPPVLLMDEPFSAIDPVVRVELQSELLRLQAQIGKTIVLVTHDLDEAIRLADHIVVFQNGGTIAQAGSPSELLTSPANEFVRSFIGRDAGLRWLSLVPATRLAVRHVRTVSETDPAPADWALEVSSAGRPTGWVRGRADSARDRLPAATFTLEKSTLRDAVDAVIGATHGALAVVDTDGRLAGQITQDDITAAVRLARSGDHD